MSVGGRGGRLKIFFAAPNTVDRVTKEVLVNVFLIRPRGEERRDDKTQGEK